MWWISRVYRKKQKRIRWKDCKKKLIIRFGPSEYTDYNEFLSHIKQTETLKEYQREFG